MFQWDIQLVCSGALLLQPMGTVDWSVFIRCYDSEIFYRIEAFLSETILPKKARSFKVEMSSSTEKISALQLQLKKKN